MEYYFSLNSPGIWIPKTYTKKRTVEHLSGVLDTDSRETANYLRHLGINRPSNVC